MLFFHRQPDTSYKLTVKGGTDTQRDDVRREIAGYLDDMENPPCIRIRYHIGKRYEAGEQIRHLDTVTLSHKKTKVREVGDDRRMPELRAALWKEPVDPFLDQNVGLNLFQSALATFYRKAGN